MPYKNMPKDMWGKMDDCVNKVQSKGHDKQSAIAICYTSLMKGKELSETLKSFRVKAAPNYRLREKASDKPSDYLIVEDEKSPTTWHLQVRKDGKPDHTLMGAAWSALHGGYRGNKYEGPDKEKAIAKLKKLYESEDMTVPSEKSIMDAPNLRGDSLQRCLTCKYSMPIVEETDGGEMQSMAMMEAKKDADIALVCTQYDFETEADWVCDGYEPMDNASAEPTDEAPADLSVTKQADGKYRWTIQSTSSFQDRDKEIVSQAALDADTERMNTAKEYGALDWWHTPIELGACDFSAMHGRIRIESGTFNDNWIAERLAEKAQDLAASIAFYHPANEPDAQGVYHHIKTYRRAILPRGKESNLLTSVIVGKEKQQMIADKIRELKERLGGGKDAESKVDALLQAAEQTDKAAEQAGLAFKEAATPPAPETPPTPETKPEATTEKGEDPWCVAEMKPEEFDAHIAKAATAILTPVIEQIGAMVKQLGETQATALKEQGASITAQVTEVVKSQKDFAARLAALEGDTPRNLEKLRASLSSDTVISKEKAEALKPKQSKQEGEYELGVTNWIHAAQRSAGNGGTPPPQ